MSILEKRNLIRDWLPGIVPICCNGPSPFAGFGSVAKEAFPQGGTCLVISRRLLLLRPLGGSNCSAGQLLGLAQPPEIGGRIGLQAQQQTSFSESAPVANFSSSVWPKMYSVTK